MGGIRIRAHHLLCIQGFRGQGYSPTFIANMARLKEMLQEAPDTPVQVVIGSDEICSFCPHMDAGNCTRPGQRAIDLDRRALAALKLPEGSSGTWSNFMDVICDNLTDSNLTGICEGCNWLDLGFCSKGIAELVGSRTRD